MMLETFGEDKAWKRFKDDPKAIAGLRTACLLDAIAKLGFRDEHVKLGVHQGMASVFVMSGEVIFSIPIMDWSEEDGEFQPETLIAAVDRYPTKWVSECMKSEYSNSIAMDLRQRIEQAGAIMPCETN